MTLEQSSCTGKAKIQIEMSQDIKASKDNDQGIFKNMGLRRRNVEVSGEG